MPAKAIFLNCNGTLTADGGYINYPDQVKLLDGVGPALSQLRACDYKLVVVSNQSAVARGIVNEKTLGEIHDRLRQLLVGSGAFLDNIYYCPYHPDGVIAKYRKQSDCRKPNGNCDYERERSISVLHRCEHRVSIRRWRPTIITSM